MNITEESYITDRLENQISWYDEKSSNCQKKYKCLKIIEISSAALIPILSTQSSTLLYLITIVSLLGALIVVIEGLINLGKYHENWIEYRGICETLRQEKYMYLTRTGIYNISSNAAFGLLVERVESVISKENVNWANLHSNNNRGEEN